MKNKDEKAKEYADRVATSGQFTSEECIQMAKDDFLTGYEAAEKDAREKAIKTFCKVSCPRQHDGCACYGLSCDKRDTFINEYDNENY